MIKVAILDDYQNISQEFVDLKKLEGKYEITVFNQPFENEEQAIEELEECEALLIMRERTLITKNLIDGLKNEDLGDEILLPSIMFKHGESTFLDDMTVKQVEKNLRTPIKVVYGADDLIKQIIERHSKSKKRPRTNTPNGTGTLSGASSSSAGPSSSSGKNSSARTPKKSKLTKV